MNERRRRAVQRAAHIYLKRLKAIAVQELGGQYEAALQRFDEDWLQIRSLHQQAQELDLDDGALACDYFISGFDLRRLRLPLSEVDFGAEAALRYAKKAGSARHAQVLIMLGEAAREGSRLAESEKHLRTAIEVLRQSSGGDPAQQLLLGPPLMAAARISLAAVLDESGDYRGAVLAAGEALNAAVAIDDFAGQSTALCNLAIPLAHLGDLEAAFKAFTASASIARRLGDPRPLQVPMAGLADVLRRSGRFTEAREAAEESLRLATDLGDRREQGRLLSQLTAIALEEEDFDTAVTRQAEAQQLWSELGDVIGLADAHSMRAIIEEQSGRWQESAESIALAVALLRNSGRSTSADRLLRVAEARQARHGRRTRLHEVMTRSMAARRLFDAGRTDQGLAALTALVEEARAVRDARSGHDARPEDGTLLGFALGILGEALEEAERPAEAFDAYVEALHVDQVSTMANGNLVGRARARTAAGDYLGGIHSYEEAIAAFRQQEQPSEHLGLALGLLAALMQERFSSFESARGLATEAVAVLRQVNSRHADKAVDYLAALESESERFEREFGHAAKRMPLALVRQILNQLSALLADGQTPLLRVGLADGRICIGAPAVVHCREVSVLAVWHQQRKWVIPLERLSDIMILEARRTDPA
ncbi:tetratricopeptide repeat protein [Kitasatospora purpeofusca]|uniref:Tetratricopeptide repeat protein n=1 Tax=Kitasatospora purpeofusca TaxID=67352 RepID=A0ABZ1TZT3_9ACTN|nr:tetratricopeptide repeat protein [Kitasatospora purpeofusca]